MAEPDSSAATWAQRMESLKTSAQQRVLNAPMPPAAMEQLIADEKANELGRFEGSPVRYMGRWWRRDEVGWVALDESASVQLDLHAERYQAATTSADATEADAEFSEMPPAQIEEGAS
ncbi:hypothetical protein LRE75_17370 [Streptomyces sp. 372A]